MFSEKKKMFETIFCSEVSVFTALSVYVRTVPYRLFATTTMDPRNWTHVSGSSYTWFIFNLNTKQCYSQITYNDTHSHRYICTHDDSLSIHPFLLSLTSTFLFLYGPTSPFYLLGDPASFARDANTHPLLSLVCCQLFSPCCFTHPKAPHRSSYIFT